MSETSTPAGGTGGGNSTPARPELAELPAKVRVHALAKLLGRSSREVMDALEQLGEGARSAQSSVTKDTALQVADALLGTAEVAEVPDAAAPPATATSAPAKQPPPTPVFATASPLFLPPTEPAAPVRAKREEPDADDEPAPKATRTPKAKASKVEQPAPPAEPDEVDEDESSESGDADGADDGDDSSRRRRRRGRRGRGRGKGGPDDTADDAEQSGDADDQGDDDAKAKDEDDSGRSDKASDKSEADDGDEGSKRRRRRRRRKGNDSDAATEDDPPNTVVHVRESRESKPETSRDEVRSVRGSTRLEAKRQRRRDGREAGRRRAPILSEAEFLARREAVDRTMVVRERPDRTQIAVLEDGVLVEHFVTSAGSGSMVGNVYLGRVQNVLPSMEAAFVDIGRGRNAVLYAGEVDWDAAGLEGKARRIEQALSTGDSVLVQVTKDPVGHKGARLTTQISLPGRFLVYVPGGGATGISRKLPENERRRLKDVLKRIVPEDAGVIIRTASEGVSEDELGRDVRRLQAQWQVIKDKVDAEASTKGKKSSAPTLLYEEPDLLIKVVRDLFTEDFSGLVVQGGNAWDTIDAYVRHVAPELAERVRRHVGPSDAFGEHRIDEQLLKALDRKVWLPSGGYLVIDRTEAMTVIDVNTGKFTGSGGNLEETVTRNNLESAEEIVRQLRLRDIGGIIVVDFIDMVLEANRDLVLRRLTECLGRDRTRHQVAEVTSLGLVQMTRKRVGTGLLEAFSTPCEHCKGRGVIVSTDLEAPASGHQHHHGGGGGGGGGGTNGKRGGRDNGKKDRDKSDRDKDQPAAVRDNTDHAPAAIEPTVTAQTKQDTSEPSMSAQSISESAWTVPPTAEPSAPSATSTEAPTAASDATSGSVAEAAAQRPASVEAPTSASQGAGQATSSTESPAAAGQATVDSAAAAPATGAESTGSAATGSEAANAGSAAAGSEAARSSAGSPVGGAEAAASAAGGSEAGSPSATGSESTAQTAPTAAGSESAAQAAAGPESTPTTAVGSESATPAAAGQESAAPAVIGSELTTPSVPDSDSASPAVAGPGSATQAVAGSESATSVAVGSASTTSATAGSESTAPAAAGAGAVTSATSDWAAVNPAAAGPESATSAAPDRAAASAAAPTASATAAGEEPTAASATAEAPAASVSAEGAAEGSAPAEQPTARRRRHGKVSRPAGAPAPAVTPVADVAVPPVPEGQSRVLSAPEGSVNGHGTQGEAGVPGVAAPGVDAPDTAALPRRHQPRRTVSRPAGPPVNTPGEAS